MTEWEQREKDNKYIMGRMNPAVMIPGFFIGLEDGVAFELYWAEFDHNDIKRKSVGQHVNKEIK